MRPKILSHAFYRLGLKARNCIFHIRLLEYNHTTRSMPSFSKSPEDQLNLPVSGKIPAAPEDEPILSEEGGLVLRTVF
jgi:hypothetical protein